MNISLSKIAAGLGLLSMLAFPVATHAFWAPVSGTWHGTGIAHNASNAPGGDQSLVFPEGLKDTNGNPIVSFNNYVDYATGDPTFYNERDFVSARVIWRDGKTFDGTSAEMVEVKPGDIVRFSIFMHNNAFPGDFTGNQSNNVNNQNGTAVARNTRVLLSPHTSGSVKYNLIAYIYADNARPLASDPSNHVVSDTATLTSATSTKLDFMTDKTDKNAHFKYANTHNWYLASTKALFNQTNTMATSGAPVGSTGQAEGVNSGNFFGCAQFAGFLQIDAKVVEAAAPAKVEQPQPAQPAPQKPLAVTGPAEAALALVASVLSGLGYWYIRTRRGLAEKLLDLDR